MSNSIDKNTVAKSFIWKFLERVFSQGVNLVVQIILARLLLPSDFGSLAIIVAITSYAALFVQSGLGTVIVQKKNLDHLDVSTLLSASLFVAFLLYLLLFFIAPWLSRLYSLPELIWPLRVQALILFLNAINSIQTGILSREMDFKAIFMRTAIAIPVAGTVGVIMAYLGFGIWALVAHNLLNMFLVVLIMFIGTKYKMGLGFSLNKAKELYSFSVKILATSLICGFGDTLRTLVIGKKYTPDDLAYYDKAYTYSGYLTQIVNSTVQSVMLPTFSRSQDDLSRVKDLSRKSSRMTVFLLFPVLLCVVASAKPLVLLLLTEKWVLCVPFLMIFCFLKIPGCITTLDKQVYYALGRSEIGLYYEIGFLIVNILVLFITVPIGIFAIAVGFTLAEYIGTLVIFIISRRIYGYSLRERAKDLIKPAINSAVMFLAVWSLSFLGLEPLYLVIIQVLVAFIVYSFMALITKDESAMYLVSEFKNKVNTLKNKNNYD